jgi:uncharacterized protein YkwD
MARIRTAAIGIAVAASLAVGAYAARPPVPYRDAPPGWEAEMLGGVNAHRANVGRHRLSWCPALAVAAHRQAEAQARLDQLFHSDLGSNAQAAGFTGWQSLAENVGQAGSVADVMAMWMGSAPHRANILGEHDWVGFGQARSASGRLYWTQSFGTGGAC